MAAAAAAAQEERRKLEEGEVVLTVAVAEGDVSLLLATHLLVWSKWSIRHQSVGCKRMVDVYTSCPH